VLRSRAAESGRSGPHGSACGGARAIASFSMAADQPLRYRAASLRRFPLGDRRDIVYLSVDEPAAVMPSNVVSILESCRIFRTLEEHIQQVCANQGSNRINRAVVESMIQDFLSTGLLVPETSIRAVSQTEPGPARRNRIASIGIVTASRLECLSRCLTSFIGNTKTYGRDNEFVVMDDSTDAGVRQTCRDLLGAIRSRCAVNVLYAGREEKERFADALIGEGLPADVVRFGLFDTEQCGYSVGANENALLLHHAGDVVFHADDDVVCRPATPPGVVRELRFFSGYNPAELDCFPNREAAMARASFGQADLLAAHEMLLGLSIPECIAGAGALAQTPARAIKDQTFRLLQNGTGQVAVTFSGILGDSGSGSCSGYLTSRGDFRARLVESEETYGMAVTSREVLQAVRAPTVSDGFWCMSYAMGLDNRNLLPPFFPVKRNSDGVFGALLRRCFPQSLTGHVPIAVLHEPPEVRQFPRDQVWRDGALFEVADLLFRIMGDFDFGPVSDPARRLRMLGRYIAEAGSADLEAFEEFVRFRLWGLARSRTQGILETLKRHEFQPSYWADDCRRHIEAYTNAITQPDYVIPQDLLDGRSPEEARRLSQRLVRRFGELLAAWPDIVEAAKSLRARGIRAALAV